MTEQAMSEERLTALRVIGDMSSFAHETLIGLIKESVVEIDRLRALVKEKDESTIESIHNRLREVGGQ